MKRLYQGTAPSALAGEKLLAFWNFNDPPTSATISIGTVNGKLSITYTGKLWSSAVAAGPYTEVTGATSPYPVDTAAATAKFFRSSQ